MERAKSGTNKNVIMRAPWSQFSHIKRPVLLRNSGSEFKKRLQAMDVFFADPPAKS